MAHQLVGEVVEFTRPVIIKPGFRRMNEETNEPEEVAAVVEMKEIPATIVGVEPRFDEGGNDLCPKLHLAFLHPERLHNLGGSGWRDAFDRALSVRPASHPDCIDMQQNIAFYTNQDVLQELRSIRRAKLLAEEAAAAAQRKLDAAADAKKLAEANPDDTAPTVTDVPAGGAIDPTATGDQGTAAPAKGNGKPKAK